MRPNRLGMEVSTKGLQASPERWIEQSNRGRKVPVVYYLTRNGQFEHPHFMEVTLSSAADGLHLKDVVNRLDFLRGNGMAGMYSWSCKRNYKNGFVWHDLSNDDLIQPAHGNEYILKGSELLHVSHSAQKLQEASGSLEIPKLDSVFTPIRRKNVGWSSRSLDLGEYKVYKPELKSDPAVNADAATQTDDKRRRRRDQAKEDDGGRSLVPHQEESPRTELSRDEISPPLSTSSPEALESLNKADGAGCGSGNCHSGRFRASASAVVMHLISCGSFSLVPPYRTVLPHGGPVDDQGAGGRVSELRVEEKEYFSGSLVEMKKKCDNGDVVADSSPVLKRSSSYNTERNVSSLEAAAEVDGFRARCIPRKPKAARESGERINDEKTLGRRGSGRVDLTRAIEALARV